MSRIVSIRPLAPALLALAVIAMATSVLQADNNGRTGKAQSPQGCNCHGTLNNSAVNVSITGPQAVRPSTTNTYTITVTGGPSGSKGGVDLRPTGGTLTAGTNSKVSSSELVHSNPNVRSWTFQWTSPAATGTQSFYAVGLTADGTGGTGGDAWNWYGGVVNTPFAIEVTDLLDAPTDPAATWLAPVSPNPVVVRTRVTFALARAGEASLDVFDATGRRVATLARGVQPAGRHSMEWDGRDDAGSPLRGGIYFLRLRTLDREISTRVLVLR